MHMKDQQGLDEIKRRLDLISNEVKGSESEFPFVQELVRVSRNLTELIQLELKRGSILQRTILETFDAGSQQKALEGLVNHVRYMTHESIRKTDVLVYQVTKPE